MKTLPSNVWNSPVIRKRLLMEAIFECGIHGKSPKDQYFFFAPQGHAPAERGSVQLYNFVPGQFDIRPHELQIGFAEELRYRLQKEIGHDGYWMVGWTHPPCTGDVIRVDGDNTWNRLVIIFMDEDADPQFSLEFGRPFAELIADGGYYFIEQAEKAHSAWAEAYGKKAMKTDLGLTDDQITKATLSSLH